MGRTDRDLYSFFGKTTVNTVAGTDIVVRGVTALKAGKVYTGKTENNSKFKDYGNTRRRGCFHACQSFQTARSSFRC